jgi:tripartite-type tricarboxylate transporter receptor subunit TctC
MVPGLVRSIVVLALLAAAGLAQAQSWPSRPIRFVVAYPPGGGSDLTARLVAPKLAERLNATVVVENRVGGGGIVGLDSIAKAPPDGYTIGWGPSGLLTINVVLQPNLPYKPLQDLTFISQGVRNHLILVAHPSLPAKDFRELQALARANPGKYSYASTGTATAHHLAGVLLTTTAGIDLVHVPYKGSGPAANDLMGGQIPLAIIDVASVSSFIKAGKLRAIGTLGLERSQLTPDIPTIAESGLPGFEARSWYGLVGPAKIPADIVARLNAQFVAILDSADTRERFLAAGVEASPSTPEQFAGVVRSEIARWTKVIRDAKISAE